MRYAAQQRHPADRFADATRLMATVSPLLMTGDEVMTISEQMNHFSNRFGKEVIVNNTT